MALFFYKNQIESIIQNKLVAAFNLFYRIYLQISFQIGSNGKNGHGIRQRGGRSHESTSNPTRRSIDSTRPKAPSPTKRATKARATGSAAATAAARAACAVDELM